MGGRKSMALPLNNHHITTREIHHGETISNWNIWDARCKRGNLLGVSYGWQRRNCWIILSSAELGFSRELDLRVVVAVRISPHTEAPLINLHVFISLSKHVLQSTQAKKFILDLRKSSSTKGIYCFLPANTYMRFKWEHEFLKRVNFFVCLCFHSLCYCTQSHEL